MNAAGVSSSSPRRRFRWLRWLLLGGALCVAATVLAAVRALALSRDAAVLRNAVSTSLPEKPAPEIQLTVGPVLFSLVRAGASLVPAMPPEARMALRAVRSASVGIYRLRTKGRELGSAEVFVAAEAAMARHGWNRVVAVNSSDAQVMVFAPDTSGWIGGQEVCVAVLDGERLIVVAGTIRADPLIDLVQQHGGLASLR